MEAAFEASLPGASPATGRRPSVGLTRVTVGCGIRAQPVFWIMGRGAPDERNWSASALPCVTISSLEIGAGG
jgi:hypothetical protein